MMRETKESAELHNSAVKSSSGTPWKHSGAMAALVALGAYLLFPTKDFYWDGISFAQVIESSHGSLAALVHPNHILYNLLGYAAWRAVAAAGIPVRALFVLQSLSAAFAAASVDLVWRILAEWTQSPRRCFWGALLFAFAAQWWRFATDANAYVPAIFFLLCSFYLLARKQTASSWSAGLAYGAALLLHQLAVFFPPAAVAALCRQVHQRAGESTHRELAKGITQYFGMAVPITAGTYLWAYSLLRQHPGVPQF